MSWSGIILVIAGALLLANNFGLLHWGWMQQWWPVFLILLGLWSIVRPASRQRSVAPRGEPATHTRDVNKTP